MAPYAAERLDGDFVREKRLKRPLSTTVADLDRSWRSRSRSVSASRSSTGSTTSESGLSSTSSRGSTSSRRPTKDLPIEFWVRSEECKEMKIAHLDYIDDHYSSREQFIEDTVFYEFETGKTRDTVIEKNMFPYETPADVEHWTLWSRYDLSDKEVESWVTEWLINECPDVKRWNYDDNAGDRSILWFHIHVYLERGHKSSSFSSRRRRHDKYASESRGRTSGSVSSSLRSVSPSASESEEPQKRRRICRASGKE